MRVEKRPVVIGEVTVGKRPVQETQQVSGTVRREEARVDHEGDVNVARVGTSGYGTGYSGSYGEATSTGMGAFSSGQFTQGMEVYGSDDDSVV